MLRLLGVSKKILPKRLYDRGRSAVIGALEKKGFVRRLDAGPIDFRGLDITPDDAFGRAAGIPCLIDVPCDKLRNFGPIMGWPCFPCEKGKGNPYVETIIQYLDKGRVAYKDSKLKLYYDTFQPETVCDVFGFTNGSNFHHLMHRTALLVMPPWRAPLDDYYDVLEERKRYILFENRLHGAEIGHEHGWAGYGPVSEKKGNLELNRLISIVDNIIANGYRVMAGADTVRVAVLRSGGEYRFLCNQGHHRTSALAALGYKVAPASPRGPVIDRADVLKLPGVVQSVYTPEQALHVFDMLFEGRPPPAALRWTEAGA